ncbi:hypothetical protein EJ08DRAFT_219760 [Tothia fuscella]|uniref:Uncharacterized protein n=1 Tax=Tothia fuscella TaxID=1048955 RepID=A0A9P4NS99_9PEZI|nr:hypothetical protein EJ08DRAFT_219760 [Tothia fuscella]
MRQEVRRLIQEVCVQRRIEKAMVIDTFLNPDDEKIIDNLDEFTGEFEADLIEMFQPESEDEEVVEESIVRVTHNEAANALAVLTLYEEQANDGDPNLLLRLQKLERQITVRRIKGGKQMELTHYFKQ